MPDPQKLSNVFITGATDGLGRGAAEFLAARGYRVFAAGRSPERLDSLARFAKEKNLPIEPLSLDVTSDSSVAAAVAEAERRSGSLDVLINNAGIGIGAVMEEISLADLYKQFETNFFGVVRVTQRVLPAMRARRRGRILNMSSIAGKVASPVMGPYSSSKHALEGLSDSLRLEMHPFGVHVILIEPGYVHTSITRNATELSAAYVANAEKSPYRSVYEGFQKSWQETMKRSNYMPEDCARVILRAIEDAPPRARYLVTRDAKIASRLKWLLSDRLFDNLMIKRFGLGASGHK